MNEFSVMQLINDPIPLSLCLWFHRPGCKSIAYVVQLVFTLHFSIVSPLLMTYQTIPVFTSRIVIQAVNGIDGFLITTRNLYISSPVRSPDHFSAFLSSTGSAITSSQTGSKTAAMEVYLDAPQSTPTLGDVDKELDRFFSQQSQSNTFQGIMCHINIAFSC